MVHVNKMISKKIRDIKLKNWRFCTNSGLVYKADEIYLIDGEFITKDNKEKIKRIYILKDED
jgi:hypothetical protein